MKTAKTNIDIDIDIDVEFTSLEEACAMAETYTKLGFEATKPRSYDGGKTFEFTVSRDS